MPSSCRRTSAAARRASRIRSPALSWATRSVIESHSGVAYSGCDPTSRYSRAPFSRNTFEDRPQWTTRRNRYRATSSGESRRCPRKVHVTPYSFSSPKIRRSTTSAQQLFELGVREATELSPWPGAVEGGDLQRVGCQGARLAVGNGRRQ